MNVNYLTISSHADSYYSPFVPPGEAIEVPVSDTSVGNPNGHYDPGISNPAMRYVPPWNTSAGHAWAKAWQFSINLSPNLNWAEGTAGTAMGASTWGAQAGGLDMTSMGLWFAGNTAGQGLVSAMEPGVGAGFKDR